MIVAHGFFHPDINIDEACATERRILRELIADARKIIVMKINDATNYAELILDSLETR